MTMKFRVPLFFWRYASSPQFSSLTLLYHRSYSTPISERLFTFLRQKTLLSRLLTFLVVHQTREIISYDPDLWYCFWGPFMIDEGAQLAGLTHFTRLVRLMPCFGRSSRDHAKWASPPPRMNATKTSYEPRQTGSNCAGPPRINRQ